ncbi:MAG: dihydropteroate synthase [Acidobacteriota bacterium]
MMGILRAERTLLMGILNVTPDSFSDGGRFYDADAAWEQARRMIDEGADILDIGGESTRPGATAVSEEEELRRVLPMVERAAREWKVSISVDTCKPAVAAACLERGAKIINDVTGFRDSEMVEVARRHGAACIVMHMRGTPATMQSLTEYVDVVAEVKEFLAERVATLGAAGIEEIAIDPGLGFAKTAVHNFQLLRRLPELAALGVPVLIGPSRKRFLGTLADMEPMENRRDGTVAAITAAVLGGARIIRAHDVVEARRAIAVAEAVLRA